MLQLLKGLKFKVIKLRWGVQYHGYGVLIMVHVIKLIVFTYELQEGNTT